MGISMTTTEIIKTVAYVLGSIVSVPFAIALFKVSFHAGGIAKAVEALGQRIEATNGTMEKFADEVRACLTEHTADISEIQGRMQGWDGNERRHRERRMEA
jgi:hypothetical protein